MNILDPKILDQGFPGFQGQKALLFQGFLVKFIYFFPSTSWISKNILKASQKINVDFVKEHFFKDFKLKCREFVNQTSSMLFMAFLLKNNHLVKNSYF